VHPAALPRGAEQHRLDRGLKPGVRVADHQLHAVQATGAQPAQERGPERAVLAVANVEAEHLPATIRGNPGGHHDGL
jgi:hypothetical protein